MRSPFVIVLTTLEEAVLTARARSGRAEHRDVLRARIVLAAAAGTPNAQIAGKLGISVDTVRKWRKRFAAKGLPGLDDLPRAGRPRRFTPVQVAQVKALACTLPAERGTGRRGRLPWPGRGDLTGHRAPVAARGRDQTVAAPVLDLPPRPRPRRQGRPGPRPLRPHLGRPPARRGRVRHQRRRKVPTPSPPPPPPRPATGARTHPPGGVRVPPRRHPGLLRRLRRPPRPGDRPHRTQDRNRALHRSGRPGHDHRALRLRTAGVLGRGQRLIPQRATLHRPDDRGLANRHPRASTDPRVLAQPGLC